VVKRILVSHSLAEFRGRMGSHHASCLENIGFQFLSRFCDFPPSLQASAGVEL